MANWIPAVIAAVGKIFASNSEAAAMEGQANIARQNAQIERQQANAREEQLRRNTALALGEQRASAAQSGFDSSIGSFADLQGESAGNAELDALTTRYEGQLQSLSFENEAAALKRNAKTARRQGYLNAFGTLASAGLNYGGALKMPTSSTTVGTMAGGGAGTSSSTVGMSY